MEQIGQQRPELSWGTEQSKQAQSALSTGSPSKSGVVGAKKSDVSVWVLLTGRQTAETAATKVKTRKQLQAQNASIQGA